jgi:hypothetical protein
LEKGNEYWRRDLINVAMLGRTEKGLSTLKFVFEELRNSDFIERRG